MRDLQRMVWGRVAAIRKRVVKSRRRTTAGNEAVHPGFVNLNKKLARASQRIRGTRHGRRPE